MDTYLKTGLSLIQGALFIQLFHRKPIKLQTVRNLKPIQLQIVLNCKHILKHVTLQPEKYIKKWKELLKYYIRERYIDAILCISKEFLIILNKFLVIYLKLTYFSSQIFQRTQNWDTLYLLNFRSHISSKFYIILQYCFFLPCLTSLGSHQKDFWGFLFLCQEVFEIFEKDVFRSVCDFGV